MKVPDELRLVAQRVVWFKSPEETLADPSFFLAHLMTYGRVEDIMIARSYFGADDFRRALQAAPAGVFDARSWTYWHLVYGPFPPPPLPRRLLPSVNAEPLPG